MSVVVVQLLHFKTLRQEHRYVIVFPFSRWKVLQEDHGFLEAHFFYLLAELKEKRRADVAVELWKTFILREVCVPKSYCLVNVEFSSKIAADPAIGEVHEVDVELL